MLLSDNFQSFYKLGMICQRESDKIDSTLQLLKIEISNSIYGRGGYSGGLPECIVDLNGKCKRLI